MHSEYPANIEPAARVSFYDQAPQEPAKALVITRSFRVADLLAMIDTGKLDISNTSKVPLAEQWSDEQATRLIESMLLRIPLPAVYFREDAEAVFRVVNGQRCLEAIRAYVRGVFPLRNPRYLTSQAGVFFPELALPLRQQLLRTHMVAHIVDSSIPHHVLCAVLGRINAGWVPLE